MAYRARHWACALDILELAAMTASAGEAAAAEAREARGMPLADRQGDGGAAASWCDWSHKLMTQHKECVSYTKGMHDRL